MTPIDKVDALDLKVLRDKFFKECTEMNASGNKEVSLSPHNLFEWFENEIQTAQQPYIDEDAAWQDLRESMILGATNEELKKWFSLTKLKA